MLYGIACDTRGWVYISSHGVGYDIPSLSTRYCVAFGRSANTFSAELQDAMADEESRGCDNPRPVRPLDGGLQRLAGANGGEICRVSR